MDPAYPPLNREFDYHRIQGTDAKYRENFDLIFRKKLTPAEESEKQCLSAVEQLVARDPHKV